MTHQKGAISIYKLLKISWLLLVLFSLIHENFPAPHYPEVEVFVSAGELEIGADTFLQRIQSTLSVGMY